MAPQKKEKFLKWDTPPPPPQKKNKKQKTNKQKKLHRLKLVDNYDKRVPPSQFSNYFDSHSQ